MLEELPALSPDVEQALYRVAQEAIANVGYHAGAHNLTVQLTHDDDTISLLVHDDGRGFAPRRAPSDEHYGLVGMQERARLVGGKLTIESQPEQGTAIRLVIRE